MKRYLPFILSLLILGGCKEEAEFPNHNLYILITDTPVVDANSVTFNANLESEGSDAILERGFVVTRNFNQDEWGKWGYPPLESITETHKISLDGAFSLKLEGDWDTGVTCTVYAYVKTSGYNYQGGEVSFEPQGGLPPVIHSVTPEILSKSGTLTIRGENFSKYKSRNMVYLDEIKCHIEEATENELVVQYSIDYIGPYYLKVISGNGETKGEKPLDMPGLKIQSVSPSNIYSGSVFTVQVEEYDGQSDISVYIGRQSARVLGKTSQEITCLCPTIEDGKDIELHIYLLNKKISTPNFSIQVPKLWEKQQAVAVRFTTYQIIENEAYGILDDRLYWFNKASCQWEIISSLPEQVSIGVFFGKGDYLYAGTFQYNFELFKYHIPSKQWEKCVNEIHGRFVSSNIILGEWIEDEYYISSYVFNPDRSTIEITWIKYLPATDTWTELNGNMDDYYRFFHIAGKTYCLSDNSLYEYNIDQQIKGELFYTFPSYVNISNQKYTMRRIGSIIYFESLMCVFGFDFVNKTFKSYGSPFYLPYYGYDFVLMFNEGVFVGCNQNSVYKYIGE